MPPGRLARWRSVVAGLLAALPRGNAITPESWERRHRAIVALTWIHVPVLFLVGYWRGYGILHPLLEVSVIAAFAASSGMKNLGRDARASLATLGLVASSGVLVHMTNGLIEMHFHFFVVVAIVALYQSWFPFLVCIGFVLLHHGVIGATDPASVYNHPAALRNPWKWASLHALFIAGESAAALIAWKLNELSVAAERATRADLEAAVADLSEAQALTHIGSWDWDVWSGQLVWSDETYRICGVEPGVTPTFEGFLSLIVAEERDEVRENITGSVAKGHDVEYEAHLQRPDGSVRLILGLGRTTVDDDGAVRLAGTVQDVTERKQALHDSLTGLPNRTLFLDRVKHARTQQQRNRATLGLLFVDLDDFKTVNDTKGHLAGDEVLRQAGSRISGVLRPGDTVARLGGDEFVVLLNGIEGAADATIVADRILEVLPIELSGEDPDASPGASIGIVVEPPPGARTASELLRDADVAMYSAKRKGKGAWEIFDETMRDLPVVRTLRSDLRRAMDEDQLVLHYQPIVRLADGSLESVEALVRWRHPDGGLVPPLEFIPIAEESGQIVDMGRWILDRACTDVASWRDRFGVPQSFTVAVNVSPVQLRDGRFVDGLAHALSESDLAPGSLMLEITERWLALDASTIARRVREISGLGVRLAIDDFGTGSSFLGSLHELAVDRLKIDKVFVDSVAQGARGAAFARAIVELGSTLGLSVVAEGVESVDQAHALQEMGCELAQGFLFSRPVDSDGIDAILAGFEGSSDEAEPSWLRSAM